MAKVLGFWVTLCLGRLQQMCFHSMWQNYENQSRHITQVQHNEPLSFTMFSYGNMGEGLLTCAEITKVSASPKDQPSMDDIE